MTKTKEQIAEEYVEQNCRYGGDEYDAFLAGYEAGQREAKPRFIHVDTEPPKDTRKMLLVVTAKGAYRFAHWMNDPIEAGRGFIAVDGAGFQLIEDVIGWLPLPDAPEGKNE